MGNLAEIKLNIANIIISIKAEQENLHFIDGDPHQLFLVNDGTPDFILENRFTNIPMGLLEEYPNQLFESGGVWKLFSGDKGYLLVLSSAIISEDPYKIIEISNDFKQGVAYQQEQETPKRNATYIIEYPLDEVIYVKLLSEGRGVETHACGLIDEDGYGQLFIGRSGTGKSTFATFAMENPGVTVLSDDRIIVRQNKEEQFQIYGTPWHGDAGVCSPRNAILKNIIFLEQSDQNEIFGIEKSDALTRLLQCSFPTFYDRDGMTYTVDILSKLISGIPSCRFGFVKDKSSFSYIREATNDMVKMS